MLLFRTNIFGTNELFFPSDPTFFFPHLFVLWSVVVDRKQGSVLQCVAVCCSVLKCVAVCCSVLQCVADTQSLLWLIGSKVFAA